MGYQTTSVSLAPVLALQGRYLRRVMPRLPEPPGARAGAQGTGPEIRLLILGDSAAAGVGASSQDEALSGRLVAELAGTFHVSWTLVARAGATTAGTTRHLTRLSPAAFDVAVVSLGGNDVTARRPLARWLEDMDALRSLLHSRFEVRHLLLSGLPPMHAFPALPQPLRWYLGATARRFDRALAHWAAAQINCEHVPLTLEDRRQLATDGMHPGPLAYRAWGALLALRIRTRWTPRGASEPA